MKRNADFANVDNQTEYKTNRVLQQGACPVTSEFKQTSQTKHSLLLFQLPLQPPPPLSDTYYWFETILMHEKVSVPEV